jgi:hypothetical protein
MTPPASQPEGRLQRTARLRWVPLAKMRVNPLAIAGELPCTVVCRGSRKTTRRYPRRFADEFAASGLDVADLAESTTRWRARAAEGGR